MTTGNQLKANRLNAQKSTGPQTVEGKRKSRMNAMKHGLCSAQVVLPNENREVFLKMADKIYQDLQPENSIEHELVERVITNLWRLKRLGFIESQLISQFMGSGSYTGNNQHPYASAFLSMCRVDLPNKLTRYENAIEASLYKALKQLEELRSARLDPDFTSS